MKQLVIIAGGFHPFHAGHFALYQSAQQAFPGADIKVAATNDVSQRPFPFAIKEKLAKLAGVKPGDFYQVKSPFQAREITQNYNPEDTELIFVRSGKDRDKPPQAGGIKKNGEPAYLQPLTDQTQLEPMSRHAYMAYLPTVEFGPGMTSATEIRASWPKLNDRRKTALVMSLYPKTQTNPKLAATVVKMLDTAIGGLDEGWKDVVAGGAMALGALGAGAQTMPNINVQQVELANKYYQVLVQRAKEDGIQLDTRTKNVLRAKAQDAAAKKIQQGTIQTKNDFPSQGSEKRVAKDFDQFEQQNVDETRIIDPKRIDVFYRPDPRNPKRRVVAQNIPTQALDKLLDKLSNKFGAQAKDFEWSSADPMSEDYIEEKWSQKYKRSINCAHPKGFSQRAHCQGRKK